MKETRVTYRCGKSCSKRIGAVHWLADDQNNTVCGASLLNGPWWISESEKVTCKKCRNKKPDAKR